MNILNDYFGIIGIFHPASQLKDITQRLKDNGAVTKIVDRSVVLASWSNSRGCGIWEGNQGSIVYDVDLINQSELEEKCSLHLSEDQKIGCLLWELYQKYNTNFVNHLRGAFSFILWDNLKKEMLIVTDPYGIRPIVFSNNEKSFTAASAIRSILIDESIQRTIDYEAVYHYFFFQAVCSPLTIYKNIRKLPPGKAIKFSDNSIKLFSHYDIRYRYDERLDESYWRKAVFDAVEYAVGKYVPLSAPKHTGCYLSGGTDSSSVAGFYTKLSGTPANTFSIGFDEPEFNEMEYAHLASNHFHTKQHDYYVTPKDVMELLFNLPKIYDEPFGNSSVIPAFFCAKLAKNYGVDVLLGGDGGDEIFGGNERYVKNLVFSIYHTLPKIFRKKAFEPLLNLLPSIGVIHKAKRYIRRANYPNPDRFFSYNLLSEMPSELIFKEDFLDGFNQNCFIELASEHYHNASPAHDTDRLLYMDMKFTITDNDLRKVTRMAEVAGVQVRYPLLDRDLVDFTAKIPPQFKVKWNRGRYIFKRAMKNFLPDEIISKKKHGMGLPIAVWFKKDPILNELLYDVLFSGAPLITQWLKNDFLVLMKTSFENDKTTYFGSNLWVLLMMELWLKEIRQV